MTLIKMLSDPQEQQVVFYSIQLWKTAMKEKSIVAVNVFKVNEFTILELERLI